MKFLVKSYSFVDAGGKFEECHRPQLASKEFTVYFHGLRRHWRLCTRCRNSLKIEKYDDQVSYAITREKVTSSTALRKPRRQTIKIIVYIEKENAYIQNNYPLGGDKRRNIQPKIGGSRLLSQRICSPEVRWTAPVYVDVGWEKKRKSTVLCHINFFFYALFLAVGVAYSKRS